MLLIVHQCFLMMLSRKIIVRKATLQTTNKFFFSRFVSLLYCIEGVVIAAQCTATSLKIYCAPPNLGIMT